MATALLNSLADVCKLQMDTKSVISPSVSDSLSSAASSASVSPGSSPKISSSSSNHTPSLSSLNFSGARRPSTPGSLTGSMAPTSTMSSETQASLLAAAAAAVASPNALIKKKYRDDVTGEWTCPVCHVKTDSQHSFTVHIRQHNPTDHSHTCSICQKQLSSASSLDRHMLIHSGERPFKCRICQMAFTTNGNMHRHMRTHGPDEQQIAYGAMDLEAAAAGKTRKKSRRARIIGTSSNTPVNNHRSSSVGANSKTPTSSLIGGLGSSNDALTSALSMSLANLNTSTTGSTTTSSAAFSGNSKLAISSSENHLADLLLNQSSSIHQLAAAAAAVAANSTSASANPFFPASHSVNGSINSTPSSVTNSLYMQNSLAAGHFACQRCPHRSFLTKRSFIDHMASEHSKQIIVCPDCNVKFDLFSSFASHACFIFAPELPPLDATSSFVPTSSISSTPSATVQQSLLATAEAGRISASANSLSQLPALFGSGHQLQVQQSLQQQQQLSGFFDLNSLSEFGHERFALLTKFIADPEPISRLQEGRLVTGFECERCEKMFPCLSALQLHNTTHELNNFCRSCNHDLKTPDLFLAHCQARHTNLVISGLLDLNAHIQVLGKGLTLNNAFNQLLSLINDQASGQLNLTQPALISAATEILNQIVGDSRNVQKRKQQLQQHTQKQNQLNLDISKLEKDGFLALLQLQTQEMQNAVATNLGLSLSRLQDTGSLFDSSEGLLNAMQQQQHQSKASQLNNGIITSLKKSVLERIEQQQKEENAMLDEKIAQVGKTADGNFSQNENMHGKQQADYEEEKCGLALLTDSVTKEIDTRNDLETADDDQQAALKPRKTPPKSSNQSKQHQSKKNSANGNMTMGKSDLADIQSIISVISSASPLGTNDTTTTTTSTTSSTKTKSVRAINDSEASAEYRALIQLRQLANSTENNCNNFSNGGQAAFNGASQQPATPALPTSANSPEESRARSPAFVANNSSSSPRKQKHSNQLQTASSLNGSLSNASIDQLASSAGEEDESETNDKNNNKQMKNNNSNSNNKLTNGNNSQLTGSDSTGSMSEEEHRFLEQQLQEQQYCCKICKLEVRSVNTLRRHKRLHEQGGHLYSCHYCTYTSLDKSSLIRHLRTHNGERPYQCTICKYAFTTKANCERHVRKRHKMHNKSEIKVNMEYQLGNGLAASKGTGFTHVTPSHHPNGALDAALSGGMALIPHKFYDPAPGDTTCRYCKVDFKFNRLLRQHLRTMCNNSFAKKPFVCTLCQMGFTSRNNCARHVLKLHPEINQQRLNEVMLEQIEPTTPQNPNGSLSASHGFASSNGSHPTSSSIASDDHSEAESLFNNDDLLSQVLLAGNGSASQSMLQLLKAQNLALPGKNFLSSTGSSLDALCKIAKDSIINKASSTKRGINGDGQDGDDERDDEDHTDTGRLPAKKRIKGNNGVARIVKRVPRSTSSDEDDDDELAMEDDEDIDDEDEDAAENQLIEEELLNEKERQLKKSAHDISGNNISGVDLSVLDLSVKSSSGLLSTDSNSSNQQQTTASEPSKNLLSALSSLLQLQTSFTPKSGAGVQTDHAAITSAASHNGNLELMSSLLAQQQQMAGMQQLAAAAAAVAAQLPSNVSDPFASLSNPVLAAGLLLPQAFYPPTSTINPFGLTTTSPINNTTMSKKRKQSELF